MILRRVKSIESQAFYIHQCAQYCWNKHKPEEIKSVADFIIQYFIENILGYSKKKQQ